MEVVVAKEIQEVYNLNQDITPLDYQFPGKYAPQGPDVKTRKILEEAEKEMKQEEERKRNGYGGFNQGP